ncbi:hypothetical protein AAFF_G00289750 [Aldrovandia affinis]|uniref:Endonuclease/exonuclease/phosphatase domain-containing protein n=1 Tax=Aldrovandia affinis TaxID=143900 RepID=A0AAD7R9V8_9TELE|nr:hypothetical protein AAFF_G00289750 [Aldrovandia affinis]
MILRFSVLIHPKYGSAVFVNPLLDVRDIYTNSSDTNIETVTVCLPEISITSLYKPPASPFVWPDIPTKCRKKYAVVIGDFNSHHTRWGYDNTNRDGELVESWMENTNMELELIHDAKLPKSFNSCRWRKGYNPDLCFISKRLAHLSEKAVLNPLPQVTTSTNLNHYQACHHKD